MHLRSDQRLTEIEQETKYYLYMHGYTERIQIRIDWIGSSERLVIKPSLEDKPAIALLTLSFPPTLPFDGSWLAGKVYLHGPNRGFKQLLGEGEEGGFVGVLQVVSVSSSCEQ